MKVVIVGCGWLGQQLAPVLMAAGHNVVVTRTTAQACATLPSGLNSQVLDLRQPAEPGAALGLLADAVVICAIAPGRQQADNQYVYSLQRLATLMQHANARAVVHFSSSGVYQGLQGDVTEICPLQSDLPRVHLLAAGEHALAALSPCVTLRLAGLIGPGRHPGRFAANKTLPDPAAAVNMVHSTDVCRAVLQLLAAGIAGTAVYNLACPQLVSRQVFYQTAAELAGTSLFFATDTTDQRRVDPQRFIQQFGFKYQFMSALAALPHCD